MNTGVIFWQIATPSIVMSHESINLRSIRKRMGCLMIWMYLDMETMGTWTVGLPKAANDNLYDRSKQVYHVR